MKILYYNWVDYLDDERRGGGVTVYQRNLMRGIADLEGVSATQLSSGISYDLRHGPPRWQPVQHGPKEDRDRRIEIVNSGTLSPWHYSFGSSSQISHPDTVSAFEAALSETGPYDVVHFNNLEGLPAEVLELKKRHPELKFVLSWHNYYPVCPQVNLWHREASHCDDFKGGSKCESCLLGQPNPGLVRMAQAVAFQLKRRGIRPGTRAFDIGFRGCMRFGRSAARGVRVIRDFMHRPGMDSRKGSAKPRDRNEFAKRRARMVELINTHVDVVHCVSERTAQIARDYGVDPQKIEVVYIGTPHAAEWSQTAPRPRQNETTLGLIYLGYMRPDKGFPFLLDALEALPDSILKRLDLKIAALGGTDAMTRRLDNLAPRLAAFDRRNGYKPDEMNALLADRDLGIVPPVWEDNLPQVALEMHCRHIPLLTSDRGGAQELSGNADYRFKAGDIADFAAKLTAILDGKTDPDAYWSEAKSPVSIEAHLQQILALYR